MSNISQKLNLGQSQNLVMTPQLQQAIKLLQLNNHEIAEFIEEEIAQNPLLEKAEKDPDQSNSDSEAPESEIETPREDFDAGSAMSDMGSGGNTNFDKLDDAFENSMSRPETLREHLVEQLHLAFDDARDEMIGALLIDQLDEAGYLRSTPDELIEQLGCSEERLTRLLTKMRGFHPTGIFAHDLKDCLALQLEEKNLLDEPTKILLDNLNMLADHDLKGLAEKCGVNETYLQDMISDIKSLNPKPAGDFDHVVVQTAIPDVLMKKQPKNLGGGWRVELNNDTLPKVLVNNEYYTQVLSTASQKKDKEYLSQQLSSASWLIKALDQRAQTILKVAAEIVEQQDAFFNYGVEFLKPLTLKDIAEVIEMHESTVSRVTNNKFIGTPRGIFELKYFFSTALVSEDGTSHSSTSIQARIQTLINEEDPLKVLSDDKIVDLLKTEGIDLARRTVAKYREGLHIPSSVQRRKQKRNQLK
ncbi:MAG: RNA polymerase factor sigma-54 [Alphaproteobacteria bacterium]|nr:RNA polymerase factor sigma-54 [Alphaproteobacteria bacterium]NCQ88592.1 RNA polymerase factor sigma-54 [Alphaproteobacteria bacterium]NCT06135.1 RNA polymerase factor sigma-54 [Alphaproteobacteria bacterium]